MIKKSYRKGIREKFISKAERKLKTIINLLNRCIYNCISIPNGYYPCRRCKAKNVIELVSETTHNDNNNFVLSECHKCGGDGYLDFVSNAMGQHLKDEIMIQYLIPHNLLDLPKLEIASIIFYDIYFEDFLPEDSTNFNFDNNHGKKTVTEFIDYFIPYKKRHEKRKKSKSKNFVRLEHRILELVKA